MSTLPRQIFTAWLQGRDAAPAIVKQCFERWTTFNPGYTLRILEADEASAALSGLNVAYLPPPAYTDILRVKLLLEHGGVWTDATVFAMWPLERWLPALTEPAGFFAYAKPRPENPISSWFLSATPGHIVMQKLWAEILRFWSRPRALRRYGDDIIPPDPVATVAPGPADDSPDYPYFWLHYLFQHLLNTDAAFAAAWGACPKVAAGPTHALQFLCRKYPRPPLFAQTLNANAAGVQKLDWRAEYPLEDFARL